MTTSFERMAIISCSVKRLSPMNASGKRGEASVHLTELKCLPLDPVTEEIRQEVELSKPYQALQTFLELPPAMAIHEKDILIVDDVEYVIRAVGAWKWDTSVFTYRLIVEDTRVI